MDIGINKPLKNRVHSRWNDFLMEQDIDRVRFEPPTRSMLAQWIVEACQSIPMTIGWNAWRHKPFSYFPLEEEEAVEGSRFVI